MGKLRRGPPSKLTPEVMAKIPELIQLGLSDVKIAEILKVKQPTLATWKSRNQAFSIAYEIEKAKQDNVIERSLFKRAVGYDKTLNRGNTQQEYHYPGDVQAQMFWLKNRRASEWKGTDIDPTSQQNIQINFNLDRPKHIVPTLGVVDPKRLALETQEDD